MLATSYGIDCALSQILYYQCTNKLDFITISNKLINRYLSKHTPNILVGLRPDHEYIQDSMVLIDNTKRGFDMFDGLPNFLYNTKVSKTNIFAKYLQIDTKHHKYVQLADSLINGNYTDQNVLYLDFYNAVEHDTFIYKGLTDSSFMLNKNEQQLALRFKKFQDETADKFIESFLSMQDGVAVCKSNYNMKDAIENAILAKYHEELFLIATWDFDSDGMLRINVCSKSDIAGKIAEKQNGDNYIRNGTFKLSYDIGEEDTNGYVLEQIVDIYKETVEETQRQLFREKQREIEESRANANGLDILDLF